MRTDRAFTIVSQRVTIQESCLSIPALLVFQKTRYTIYKKDQYCRKQGTGVF